MDEVATAVGRRLRSEPISAERLDAQIGEVVRVELEDGRTVVGKRGPGDLSIEATMLNYLREHDLPVPEVLNVSQDLIVLEFVPGTTDPSADEERTIAEELAALHEHTVDYCGFSDETMLGPYVLPNTRRRSWIKFFREFRLEHFRDLTLREGAIDEAAAERIDDLAADLDDLLTEPEDPALLHGDVWRENVLVDDGEVAAFLDPACYYGHPEEELAYVDWTDAYGEPFFETYREHRGIDDGFDERKLAYSVPRILIHAHLFGEDYPEQLATTLDKLGY